MKFAIALVSCLLLMTGAAFAAQPAMITANVIHDQTQGVLRVNGVPVQRFSSTPAADSGPLTDAVGIGQWLVEGDNVIEVEATGPAGFLASAAIAAAWSAICRCAPFSNGSSFPIPITPPRSC